jgi:endonuclease YncB( thermonuclease family)
MIRPFPLLALLLITGPASAASVLSVGDGDTVRVMEGSQRLTIRLACIDAPETAQRPYGAASRQRLQELAPVGSVVSLRPQTTDKYGRTVAEVFRNGQNVNLAIVSSGQAFAYRKYLAACDGSAYLGAEAAAQRQRIGVWAVPGGIQRPWDWRKGNQRPWPSCRPARRGPCWWLQRPEAHLPGDRQLCPRPGAAETGAHLPRQERRWGGLRIIAVSPVAGPPQLPNV